MKVLNLFLFVQITQLCCLFPTAVLCHDVLYTYSSVFLILFPTVLLMMETTVNTMTQGKMLRNTVMRMKKNQMKRKKRRMRIKKGLRRRRRMKTLKIKKKVTVISRIVGRLLIHVVIWCLWLFCKLKCVYDLILFDRWRGNEQFLKVSAEWGDTKRRGGPTTVRSVNLTWRL